MMNSKWRGSRPSCFGFIVSACTLYVCACILFPAVVADNTNAFPRYNEKEPSNLVLLQMLFRHGDRSPMASYRNDSNDAYWPQGFAQLTKVGMEQAFEYGKELRQRYVNFLPNQYNPSEVYVRSTDIDRTLMTAQNLLTGIFPINMPDWKPGVWQPIPVHTQAREDDHLFAHAPCPRGDNLQKKWWTNTSPAAAKHIENYRNLLNTLAKPADLKTLDDLSQLSDTIFCETAHNLTRPSWLTDDIHKQLMDFKNESVQFLYVDPVSARLFGGPLLTKMTNNMEAWANHTSSYKLLLFSAHDSNIISLGRVMGIMNNLQPPYLTSITVELYEQNEQFFVRVLFDNHTQDSPYVQNITGCDVMCPLQQFHQLLQQNMLSASDRKTECALLSLSRDDQVVIMTGVVMVLAVAVAVMVFFVFRSRQKRRRNATNFQYRQLMQETTDNDTDDDEVPMSGL